jgi:excisionase family DNA binding protein
MTGKPLRVAELAERWDCSPGKVRKLIHSGQLGVLRLGATMVRIPLESVLTFEEQWKHPIVPPPIAPAPGTHGTAITSAVAVIRAARIMMRARTRPQGGVKRT